MVDPVFY